MSQHTVGEAGRDYLTETQNSIVKEQLSNAYNKTKNMLEHVEPKVPKPVDSSYFTKVIPDYKILRQS